MTDIVLNVTIRPERVEPIRFGGYEIHAPGFDAETFASAIERAFADGLHVTPGHASKAWRVANPVVGTGYAPSRHGCTRRAGQVRTHGNHRTLALPLEAMLARGAFDSSNDVAPTGGLA